MYNINRFIWKLYYVMINVSLLCHIVTTNIPLQLSHWHVWLLVNLYKSFFNHMYFHQQQDMHDPFRYKYVVRQEISLKNIEYISNNYISFRDTLHNRGLVLVFGGNYNDQKGLDTLIESIYSHEHKFAIIEIFYINYQSDAMTGFEPSFYNNVVVYQ